MIFIYLVRSARATRGPSRRHKSWPNVYNNERFHRRSFSIGPMRRGAVRDATRKTMNFAPPILLHSNRCLGPTIVCRDQCTGPAAPKRTAAIRIRANSIATPLGWVDSSSGPRTMPFDQKVRNLCRITCLCWNRNGRPLKRRLDPSRSMSQQTPAILTNPPSASETTPR